jgi:hypothetical protein
MTIAPRRLRYDTFNQRMLILDHSEQALIAGGEERINGRDIADYYHG